METSPFELIDSDTAAGITGPAGWSAIADVPLTVLVGVTGVGKSTAVEHVAKLQSALRLLPDRRVLTDRVLIPAARRLDNLPPLPVTDRVARFRLTARYREVYPGGMAHVLSTLWVREGVQHRWLFDGLRGVDECRYAVDRLPLARFAVLHAPDYIRLLRLLGRADAFDRVGPSSAQADRPRGTGVHLPAWLGVEEVRSLEALLRQGEISEDELAAKAAIVEEERRHYDPQAARQFLEQAASVRTLVLDTVRDSPREVAEALSDFLERPA